MENIKDHSDIPTDDQADHDWLNAIIDSLLPGDDHHWPAASRLGLTNRLVPFLQQHADGQQLLERLHKLTQPAFAGLSRGQRIEYLQQLESSEPALFERLLTATYNMYYTDPIVRQVIERITGYEARPPQPDGYVLAPFDEKLLDKVRERRPFWRQEND